VRTNANQFAQAYDSQLAARIAAQPAAILAAAVDELGSIDTQLAPYRTLIAREQVLRTAIRGAYKDDATAGEIRVDGAEYDAVLGAPGNQTVIDLTKLVRTIKPTAFAKFATTTLTALKEHVATDIYNLVTAVKATGPRSLKTFVHLAKASA
jgi:hypothetical protein